MLNKYRVAFALLVSYWSSLLKRRSRCSLLMEPLTSQRMGTGIKPPLLVGPGAVCSYLPQCSRVLWARG